MKEKQDKFTKIIVKIYLVCGLQSNQLNWKIEIKYKLHDGRKLQSRSNVKYKQKNERIASRNTKRRL